MTNLFQKARYGCNRAWQQNMRNSIRGCCHKRNCMCYYYCLEVWKPNISDLRSLVFVVVNGFFMKLLNKQNLLLHQSLSELLWLWFARCY